MRRALLLLLPLAACQPIALEEKVYQCDVAHPCSQGYFCDCNTCVPCTGDTCKACKLDAKATSWWRLDSADGGRAEDCTGRGNDGAWMGTGTMVDVDAGVIGNAWFSSTAGDLVATAPRTRSVSFWIQTNGRDGAVYEESSGLKVLYGGQTLSFTTDGVLFKHLSVLGSPNGSGFLFVVLTAADGVIQVWVDAANVFDLPEPAAPTWARFSLGHGLDDVRTYDERLLKPDIDALHKRTCER